MLDRRNCVLELLKNGCDCVSRNRFGWNPVEEAIMLGDMDLIEKLTLLKFRDYHKYLNKKEGTYEKWNEVLPYYHFRAQLKFKTKIPLLDKIGIKDIEHLYKRGKDMRYDFGFSGVDLRGVIPKMMKGSMSLLLKFKDNGAANVYLLDNKSKRYIELYPELSEPMMGNYLKSKMGIKTLFKFYFDYSDFKVKKSSNKGFGGLSNKKRVIKVNGNKKYTTDVFKFKDVDVIIRKRDNEKVIGDYKSHIKTTVQDLDKSRNTGLGGFGAITQELNESLFSGSEKNEHVMEDIIKQEKKFSNVSSSESDSDDSDSDDSDIEEDSISESKSKNKSKNNNNNNGIIEADNDFKKFIDANIFKITSKDSKLVEKVIYMIIRGKDDNGNTIEKSDILYIHQLIPSFFSTYVEENHLPEKEQKKLEEIYHSVIEKNDGHDHADIEKNSLVQNLKNSSNVSSMVHNIADTYFKNTAKKSSKSIKYEETKKEAISEEEYFDPKNTESLHMGRVMEISEEKKHVKTLFKTWLTKENTFPLNTYHFMPLVEMVSLVLYDQVNVNPKDNDNERNIYDNIANFVLKEIDGAKRFPLKFEIPILAGTVLQYKYIDIESDEKCAPESLFEIPSDYQYDANLSFKFLK
jgi:hypothetical protein